MPSSSEIILSANTHPGDSTTETITGSNFKGDGYFEGRDGVHTVSYDFTGLTGTHYYTRNVSNIPSDTDWFHVHTYTALQTKLR